jgi:hypothetical protein
LPHDGTTEVVLKKGGINKTKYLPAGKSGKRDKKRGSSSSGQQLNPSKCSLRLGIMFRVGGQRNE